MDTIRETGYDETQPQYYVASKKDHKLSHFADTRLIEDAKKLT